MILLKSSFIVLEDATDDFDVKDCFDVLKAVSQEVCPTTVSMVYDVTDQKVFWCEERRWYEVHEKSCKL